MNCRSHPSDQYRLRWTTVLAISNFRNHRLPVDPDPQAGDNFYLASSHWYLGRPSGACSHLRHNPHLLDSRDHSLHGNRNSYRLFLNSSSPAEFAAALLAIRYAPFLWRVLSKETLAVSLNRNQDSGWVLGSRIFAPILWRSSETSHHPPAADKHL